MKWSARYLLAMLIGLPSCLPVPAAAAETVDFPKRVVRIVVPFSPGGPTDVIGRIVADKLQQLWGQSVIVENKPGAGTVIGTDSVAKSPPDGHTIGVVITAHVINPTLRSKMPFDTTKDLAGVTQLTNAPIALVAHPSLPANTVPELIEHAKRNPGKLSYASPGSGTATHLAGELLNTMAGIDLVHVPYKGSAPALTDLIGGQVPLMFDIVYSVMPHVKEGKLKILALASPERDKTFKQYSVIAETLPGFSVISLSGLVVPSATPRPIIDKIQADVAKVLSMPETREKVIELGMEPVGSLPKAFDALIQNEIKRWAPVIKAAGAQVE
jgi:tripartite-type tricarboxylate transporter receptor subunit TctC